MLKTSTEASDLTSRPTMKSMTSSYDPLALQALVVCGRDEILALSSDLQSFAGSVQQPGAMHGLEQLIDGPYSLRKIPYLVCISSSHLAADAFSPDHLVGFALFFEYRVGPLRTGLFATGDDSGVRTVIAAPGQRAWIAARACFEMTSRYARLVLASFKFEGTYPKTSMMLMDVEHGLAWAMRTRKVRDHLALKSSYDATLATLGKRTRTHLRYYRRKLQTVFACSYIPDATFSITQRELRALNVGSLDPLPQSICDFRYRTTANSNGGFVSGLRAEDGRWLGLIGGWRQGNATVIQWQMNSASYEKFSLGTVLRSYCIEHEVERGATKLMFHGGTSHSMNHSFPVEQVVDMIFKKRGILASLIVWSIPFLSRSLGIFAKRGNFLADVLKDRNLRWATNESEAVPTNSALYPPAAQR